MIKFLAVCRFALAALVVSMVVFTAAPARAQDGTGIDLSGSWKFLADREHKRGDTGDASKGFHLPEFDDSAWRDMLVGMKWENQGLSYDGIAWYRRQFDIPADWQGRTLVLQLGSPDDAAEVYLNGQSLGKWKFNTDIFRVLPPEHVRWGQRNTLAVRVWDWYKAGGLGGTQYRLEYVSPLRALSPTGPVATPLSFMQGMADNPADGKNWEPGWRDGGTSDTRPRLSVERNAREGQDAIVLDAWYPNSAEYVDGLLDAEEGGAIWDARGYDHLTFWYQTESLAGHMTVRLTSGKHVWGAGGVEVWEAEFPVAPTPSGQWRQVTLPLADFTRPVREGTADDVLRLRSAGNIRRVVVGYANHALRSPGVIKFAGFEAARSVEAPPFFEPISLRGLWRWKPDDVRPDGTRSEFDAKAARDKPDELNDDHRGYGEQLGYHAVDFNDETWAPIAVTHQWSGSGGGPMGPTWFRQKVVVPSAWQGRSLVLNLGNPRDRAVLYWNGKRIGQTTENDASLEATIPAEDVRFGEPNQIAVQVTTWRNQVGFYKGQVQLAVADHAALTVARAGEAGLPGLPGEAVAPGAFEMGTRPPGPLDMVFSWQGVPQPSRTLRVNYSIRDCFHRQVADGEAPLTCDEQGRWRAIVKLSAAAGEQLFHAEWFRATATVVDDQGRVVAVRTFPDDSQKHLKFRYDTRDALALPPLDSPVIEATPYGNLKLVDVIDCSADPATGPHPYKQGGIRNSWVRRRAYATWRQGVEVKSFKDRQYREANNNEFFAYRVGRGSLKPHKGYVLRVLVPDHEVRYQVMEIKAGRNYQGTGFRSGVRPDWSTDPFPLSNEYQWYDHIVYNDETTYGYQGDRAATSEHGFWVVFHDNGRSYTPEYQAGPAAAEIRLYELPDDDSALPAIRYPEGLPRRVLMMDWERQPEAVPMDTVRYAQHMGMNAIGPVMQKWLSHAFFESTSGMKPPGWYRASPEGQRDEDVYGWWLDATRKASLSIIPRIEYGGGPDLPKEARVIGPNGKIDPCGRFVQWGANILHPATWDELKLIVDELIGREIPNNPQIAGLLWRQRSDRIKISFGPDDVALFCKETGRPLPEGDAVALAKWASQDMKEPYEAWWQTKRVEFLRRLRDLLKSYRPDLVLYYYNWDADGWIPGVKPNNINKAQDWSDFYNVERSAQYMERFEAIRRKHNDQFFVDHVSKAKQAHYNIYPNMFDQDRDIVVFAPVHWQYLANSDPYINYFRTGDGLAICDMFSYEEKGRWNLQGDRYESSEMTPGGRDFGMAYMVQAFYHGDPNVITTTTYTYGRGWADVHRRFAQAFLALPDQPGRIVENAVDGKAADAVRVRTYDTPNGTYVSVVSRVFAPVATKVRIPTPSAMTVTNLVTGEAMPATFDNGAMVLDVTLPAMTLDSYLLHQVSR